MCTAAILLVFEGSHLTLYINHRKQLKEAEKPVQSINAYQYFNQESVRASVCHGYDVTSATCTLGTRLQRIP